MPDPLLKKIAIGTVQFGLDYGISNQAGITEINEAAKILAFAKEFGIDLIDTAYAYGRSEEVLGEVGIEGFRVVSKFLPDSNGLSMHEQVKTTLKRLRMEHLYGLLAHRPLGVMERPDSWKQLMELKHKGVVDKIGFSFNTPEEADQLLDKGYEPDLIQVPFNYLDKRFVNIMAQLKAKGCEIHTRSAFLQGLFFMSTEELPAFFDEVKPFLSNIQRQGSALPGLLLKYCTNQSSIDKVVIGINNKQQLEQNLNSLSTEEILEEHHLSIRSEILTPSEWPKIK
ncbi:MAG: aldo/keto reductase [Bacteroidales bacterium]